MKILSPREYVRTLPSDILIREAWHSHEPSHVKAEWISADGFGDRSLQQLGYSNSKIYSPGRKSKRYTVAWVPILATQEGSQAFATIFDHFNITSTLNVYPVKYFKWWAEFTEAENFLNTLKRNIKIVQPEEVKLQEKRINELKAKRPGKCFVDLAIDIDSGPEQDEVKTLDDALGVCRRISTFFRSTRVPHQVFFSGSKGFHIVVDHRCFGQTIADNNHHINKVMIELLTNDLKKISYDSSLYSSRRQLRLVNTRHPKSGLFKVLLNDDDLSKSISKILKLSETPRNILTTESGFSDYMGELYSRAQHHVTHQKQYDIKPRIRKKIQAARQSQPGRTKQQINSQLVEINAITELEELHLPPCMKEARDVGVVDRSRANRNQITMIMAMFYKEIGRDIEETTDFLRHHAQNVLARFSASSSQQIDISTIGAVKAIFTNDQYTHFNCNLARKLGLTCADTCEWYRDMREAASSRRLYTISEATDDPKTRKVFTDVFALRRDMVDVIDSYVEEMHQPGAQIVPLHVKVPPGVGKTTCTFQWLGTQPLFRVLWVGSYHKLYENIPPTLQPKWLQIMGRHGDIKKPDGSSIPANCSQHEKAAIFRDKRLNVNELVCLHCEDKNRCDYFSQFEDYTKNWFVMQPMFLHKVRDYINNFDVVVIDEEILGQFIEKISICESDVSRTIELVHKSINDLESIGNISESLMYRRILIVLKGLYHLLRDNRCKGPTVGNVLLRSLNEYCMAIQMEDNLFAYELKDILKEIGTQNFNFLEKLIHPNSDPSTLPLNFTLDLLNVLYHETSQNPTMSNLSRLALAGEISEDESWVNKLYVYKKITAPLLTRPTIILDATGQKAINEALFESPIRVYDPDLKLQNPIEVVYSTSGSKTSLHNKRHRDRMFQALEKRLHESPNSLVVCKQIFEPEIKARLPDRAEYTHYFGNRGSNEFSHFDQVILFGIPGLPTEEVLLFGGALFYKYDLKTTEIEILKQFPDTDKAIKVRCFVEPKLQAIAEAFREVEMIQSAHRIRLLHDPKKKVAILAGIVLEGFSPSSLMTLTEMVGDSKKSKRIQMLEEIVNQQLDKIGFTCPALTLNPMLANNISVDPSIIQQLKQQNLWIDVPEKDKVALRTLEKSFKEVRMKLGLCKRSNTHPNSGRGHPITEWFRK